MVSNTTLGIEFCIDGLVTEEGAESLSKMAKTTLHFHEQVIVTVRSAELTDVSAPRLGLIKRRILEKNNRSFGERRL